MEDFVTFNQAVKLKDLGFRWDCNHYYDTETGELIESHAGDNNEDSSEPAVSSYDDYNGDWFAWDCVSIPTLAQVQKWLRDVHKIEVRVCMEFDAVFQPKGTWEFEVRKFDAEFGDVIYGAVFPTYEQALSAGIDQALEIIKR